MFRRRAWACQYAGMARPPSGHGSCPRRFHLSSGDLRLSSLRANGKRLGHPWPAFPMSGLDWRPRFGIATGRSGYGGGRAVRSRPRPMAGTRRKAEEGSRPAESGSGAAVPGPPATRNRGLSYSPGAHFGWRGSLQVTQADEARRLNLGGPAPRRGGNPPHTAGRTRDSASAGGGPGGRREARPGLRHAPGAGRGRERPGVPV